jgi:hypothetical protein
MLVAFSLGGRDWDFLILYASKKQITYHQLIKGPLVGNKERKEKFVIVETKLQNQLRT